MFYLPTSSESMEPPCFLPQFVLDFIWLGRFVERQEQLLLEVVQALEETARAGTLLLTAKLDGCFHAPALLIITTISKENSE